MLPITLNGQAYNFPTELHEISLGQFFALRKAKGLIDEICALTGLDRQSIQNFKTPADLEKCAQLLGTLGDKLAAGFEGEKLPKQIVLGGKTIKIPKNLKLEPVGAFIAVHNLINEEYKRCAEVQTEFDPTDIIPQVLAQYLYRPLMGQDALYSDERIEDEAYTAQIMQLPITEAVPMANFFFRKFPHL